MVLAKMATHADYAGCDVGRRLMADVVMKRAEHLAAEHACIGVYVDAKSGAVGFYAKMDFVSLAPEREEGDPRRTTPMFRLLK
jgi:GNAT superfamily N-acetyltransferase